jgi:hypothetical protein
MFSITLSHFERIIWIFVIIFEENSLISSFMSYGLVTKSLKIGCTFEEGVERIKCQKTNGQQMLI